jgi:hypothetical protein
MKESNDIDRAQKIIKKSIDAGLLIEPYSQSWIKPRLDQLFDEQLCKSKTLKINTSNYFIASLKNKNLTKELFSLYEPLSDYFDRNCADLKSDFLSFLLVNLQTKQLLMIRIDQEFNLIETDIDFNYARMKNIDLDKIKSNALKLPNYKNFLKCDYLGLVNEFITLIAMIAKLLSKIKQADDESIANDDPLFKEISQKLDKVKGLSHSLDKATVENIDSRLKELFDMTNLCITRFFRVMVNDDSIEKQVVILCKNDSPANLLISLRDKLHLFFPQISHKI